MQRITVTDDALSTDSSNGRTRSVPLAYYSLIWTKMLECPSHIKIAIWVFRDDFANNS